MTSHNEDKPLYELDDSPLYTVPDNPEPPVAPTSEQDDAGKRPSPLRIMFKTMLGPMEGWKALKRARFTTEEFASRCFYPMTAIAALSEGSMLFYEANMTMADWAKAGLSTFIAFFFGYFTVLFLGSIVLPVKSRDVFKKDIGKQFIMLSMSTLAMFWAIINLIPMLDPVFVFLPLWTIYIVFKGVRRLRVPEEVQTSTTGLLCMLIIGVPLLWHWILTELLIK